MKSRLLERDILIPPPPLKEIGIVSDVSTKYFKKSGRNKRIFS